nr:hypothetical protein [Tanacetum cinerariifolium]
MQTRSSSRLTRDQTSNPTSSTNTTPKGRNRRSSKQKVKNSNLEEHLPPIVTMADNRTMGVIDMPPKRTSTSEAPAMTQAVNRQLVVDSVSTTLETQAVTMERPRDINVVNVAGTLVPTVGQVSPNSTNTFSAVGPLNAAASPTYGKSSFIDASQLPDDPDMPELEDITYYDNDDNVGAEAGFNNLETSIT